MQKNKKKPSMRDRLFYFHTNGIYNSLMRYLKVNTFYVFFEMLITAYSLELVAILTKFFISHPENINQLFVIMLVPTLVALPVAACFSGWFVLFCSQRFYYYHKKASDPNESLERIIKEYGKEVVIVHIIAMVLYSVASLGITCYLLMKYPSIFLEQSHLIFWMTLLGSVLGIIWNITGIFRDQRILWNVLVPKLNTIENAIDVASKNYRCFCGNVIGNATSLLVLFSLIVFIFFSINDKLDIKALTTDYWFLIIYYFTLIALYVKHGFGFLYSNKNMKEAMFPTLAAVIGQYAENLKKHNDAIKAKEPEIID